MWTIYRLYEDFCLFLYLTDRARLAGMYIATNKDDPYMYCNFRRLSNA